MNPALIERGLTALQAFREHVAVGKVIGTIDLALFNNGMLHLEAGVKQTAVRSSKGMLIIDLECTCSNDNSINRSDMEIIQIGAVVLDSSMEIIATFDEMIKPVIHPQLTPFCTQLTGITQSQVDGATSALNVFTRFDKFVAEYAAFHGNQWGSWGNFDANQFAKDFKRLGRRQLTFLDKTSHHNLKEQWAKYLRVPKQLGLGSALHKEGLRFDGNPHNALDDARNIARLAGVQNYIKSL